MTTTNAPADEGRGAEVVERKLSRQCAGVDGGITAHEFCSWWHYVDGVRVYYCTCECGHLQREQERLTARTR